MKRHTNIINFAFAMVAICTWCVSANAAICQKNFYIAKCGSFAITPKNVLEELFNLSKTADGTNGFLCIDSENKTETMSNFRNFMQGVGNLRCRRCPDTTGTGCTAEGILNIPETQYNGYRTAFLKNNCKNKSVSVTCTQCPNGSKTDGTSDVSNPDATGDTNYYNWTSFNSIANCYVDEFNDGTGTYKVTGTGSEAKPYKFFYNSY